MLENIQKFLGVGKIYKLRQDYIHYSVNLMNDLEVLLNHLDKFPLLTQKYGDYKLFKQAYKLVLNKEHLTPQGLRKIVAIKASLNLGLSDLLKISFPDIIPVARSLIPAPQIKDGN